MSPWDVAFRRDVEGGAVEVIRPEAGELVVMTLREHWNSRLAAFGLRLDGTGCGEEASA